MLLRLIIRGMLRNSLLDEGVSTYLARVCPIFQFHMLATDRYILSTSH